MSISSQQLDAIREAAKEKLSVLKTYLSEEEYQTLLEVTIIEIAADLRLNYQVDWHKFIVINSK